MVSWRKKKSNARDSANPTFYLYPFLLGTHPVGRGLAPAAAFEKSFVFCVGEWPASCFDILKNRCQNVIIS